MYYKFDNIDYKAYSNVLKESPNIIVDKELHKLSEQALIDKGMNNYLDSIDKKMIKTRIMYGFLGKRSAGKVKFFQKRWFFLISSKPLNFYSYSEDQRVMDETLIPPLLELDTIYYYIMGKEGDTSS